MRDPLFRHAIAAFPQKKLAVIGDLMLDVYEYGLVSRQSPEAPVPVIRMQSRLSAPGGAANTACNARGCGAAVALFGVVGADPAGEDLRRLLRQDDIDISGVFTDATRPTTEKKRIVGANGHMLRADYEFTAPLAPGLSEAIWKAFATVLPDCAVIVVTDYAKGVMSAALAERVTAAAMAASIPLVVDTKPANAAFYRAPAILTPNAREACEMAGNGDARAAGQILARHLGAPVIVTSGAEGISLFGEGAPLHLAAIDVAVADVSGAGDTVTAGVALGLAAGLGLADAMRLSNLMAALAVAKKGTAAVSAEELLQAEF